MIPQPKEDPWAHIEQRREAANETHFVPMDDFHAQGNLTMLLAAVCGIVGAVVIIVPPAFFGIRWLFRTYAASLVALCSENRIALILGGLLLLCAAVGAYMLRHTTEYRRTGRDFADSTLFDTLPGGK